MCIDNKPKKSRFFEEFLVVFATLSPITAY